MYQLQKNYFGGDPVIVIRLSDNAFIPLNAPDNTDYQAYLKWVAEGNIPLPVEEQLT